MAKISAFDRLVGELSDDERREFLETIRRSASVSADPLFPERPAGEKLLLGVKEKLATFPFLVKILIYLKRVFTGRTIESLVADEELKEISRAVELKYAGLIDARRGLLLAPFRDELVQLKKAARFFYDVLDRSVDKDKASFYAFLGAFELPELHGLLLSSCDPLPWSEAHPEAGETELRESLVASMDEAFSSLSDQRRRSMYEDLRCLLFLKKLAGFLFDRLITLFRPGAGPEGCAAATFVESRELLEELADILFSLSNPPSIELVESLFAFIEEEAMAVRGAESAAVLKADIGKAEAALAVIRAFNRRVPLVDILRLEGSNPSYRPRELPAGEDWLAVYKGFWKARLDASIDALRTERRYRRLNREITNFVGEGNEVSLRYIAQAEDAGGGLDRDSPPCRYELALSFIDAFARSCFAREFNRPLKIVLVDGDFYRKENGLEFTDAYNVLLHASESIAALDAKFAPEGEIGQAWNQAKAEMAPLPIKKRKIQAVVKGADDESEEILREVAGALAELVRIIRGILKGEAGGRYDSLSNLAFLDGKANKDFLKSLDLVRSRCEKAIALLRELSGLDLDTAAI
jgi:hypothetical protein